MKKVKEKIVGYHAKFVNIMHTYRCQEIQRCELKMQKEILYRIKLPNFDAERSEFN